MAAPTTPTATPGTTPPADATVQWDKAAEYLTGPDGTHVDPPETPAEPAPEFVEVSLKGRKIKVSAEDAAAIESFRTEVRERDGRLGGELAQMRERLARTEGALDTLKTPPRETAPDVNPPDPKLAMEDWSEYCRQNSIYHTTMMARMQADLENKFNARQEETARRTADDSRTDAWVSGFYADNPHLNKPHLRATVQAAYQEHAADIHGAGSVADQHARLAALAEDALVALRDEAKEINRSRRPPRLEGAATPTRTEQPAETPKPRVTGASWVARERARQRGAVGSK